MNLNKFFENPWNGIVVGILFLIFFWFIEDWKELTHPHKNRINWTREERKTHLKKYHPKIYERDWKDEENKNGNRGSV